PGWAQRIVSDWQMGGIANYVTGAPLSFTTGVHPFSNNETGRPNLVGAAPSGSVAKLANGVTYFNGYNTILDPTYGQVAPNCTLASQCNGLSNGLTNRAFVDPKGNLIMTNPLPGTKGNLFQNTLRGPGALYFDMNMVKRIRVDENKNVELRVDIVN